MSFLSGLVKLGKTAFTFLSGNTVASSLVKTTLLGLAVNQLSKNALKGNGSGTKNIDNGVRLQLSPNADSKIPVLYGSAFFGGNITDAQMTNNNKTMWYAITLTEVTGTLFSSSAATGYTFNNIYWNDQRVIFKADGITVDYTQDREGTIDRSLSDLVKIYCYTNGGSNPAMPSGYSGTLFNAHAVMPTWTSGTHPMTSLVFALVRVDYNRDRNVTGIGNLLFHVTSTMNKPGDVIYDYLTNTRYGASIASAEVDTAALTTLNTFAATSVNYDDQGLGVQTLANRYQINGIIDTANTVLSNLENICSSTASWLSYDNYQGLWTVIINRSGASTASFDNTNIIGSISVKGTGLQDLYNEVKVEFPHRELKDSADFVSIEIASEDRNSNEQDNTLDLSYDIINEPVQAQLLGFIELKQSRVDLIINFKTDYSYIGISAGDIIDVSNDIFDFTDKLFRVITVSEQQDTDGALTLDITALEYSNAVYSVADLSRFTRTDSNGIISIGSIGTPGTPTATKYELDTRPRIEVTSNAPTGVVEGLEFWITFDAATTPDSNRSYQLIATLRPTGGGVYTSGTPVTLTYDQLSPGDFLIKTRGFNTTTVGPFSTPSGIVTFNPTQITNAITDQTSLINGSTGGLLTALTLFSLLNKIDELFDGDISKSVFEKVFEIFEDVTGIDLVGDASGGDLVVRSSLTVKADGTELTTDAGSLDFTGALTATGTTDVEVSLIPGQNDKDILAWNAAAGEWQLISDCIACEFDEPPVPAVPCSLELESTLPIDKNSWGINDCLLSPPLVPHTGSYYMRFRINPGSDTSGESNPARPVYAALEKGIGNVYLYASDGTLEQTIPESSLVVTGNVVEIPLANRTLGRDYYITMDEGLFTTCECESAEIDDATTWNFTVAPYEIAAYTRPAATTETASTDPLYVTSISHNSPFDSEGICPDIPLIIAFSENIEAVSGSVEIRNFNTNALVESFAIGSGAVTETAVEFAAPTGLDPLTIYKVVVPANLVRTTRTTCGDGTTTQSNNTQAVGVFFIAAPLTLTSFEVCTLPYDTVTRTNIRSNIKLNFSRNIAIKSSAPAEAQIREGDGTLHQTIDLLSEYDPDKVGEIYQVGGRSLLLNPTNIFKPNTNYYVVINSGVILDAECGTDGPTINSSNVLFKTDGIRVENVQDVPLPTENPNDQTVTLDFDKPVEFGTGSIEIIDENDVVIATIASNDPAITLG